MAVAAAFVLAASAAASPALTIELAPRPAAVGGQVERVDVNLRFTGVEIAAGEPVLQLPLIASNVDTVAATLDRVEVRDALGVVPLGDSRTDLPVEAARDAYAGGPSRSWIAARRTRGALTVRYAVPAAAVLPPRGAAPPFAFSNDGGGTSAAGHVFLLLPPGTRDYRTRLTWNLSALPRGSRAASSWGVGNVAASEPLKPAQLRAAYFMAGAIGVWQKPAPRGGFFSAWQGKPPFDAAELMRWTGALYGRYAVFFGQRRPPPYGVFLRFNPINAGGGVGLHHSFVTTFGRAGGPGSDPDDLRSTLAHEMFHTFQPFIEQPAGLESSWFGEGLATFYQARLPLRFGMIQPQAFLDNLNFHAGRYYTSAMASAPNSEVPKRFWADTRIRTLPYDRGMLYFATVDAAVRKASGGTRSLDQLMLAMLARQQAGKVTTNADWEQVLEAELGASAVADFRAFLDGRIPLPDSTAFGPCFRRVAKPMRRYELGFDPAVLAEPQRIVRGLVPGSAAAAAGLRDGDEIVVPVPQDSIQGEQDRRLDLSIKRDEQVLAVTYLPRGETVEAWQWERVSGLADSACAL